MLALCIPLQVLASESTEEPAKSISGFLHGDKNKDPTQEEALAYPIVAVIEVMGLSVNGLNTRDTNNRAWVSVADCAYEIGGASSYEAFLSTDLTDYKNVPLGTQQCEPIPQHSITEVLECYGMRSSQIFKKD